MKLFLVEFAQFAIAFILPVLFVWAMSWPRPLFLRALIAVVACWFTLVCFVVFVCCPMEVADAKARGDENPEARCDNNNIGPLIFMGWTMPTISIGLWSAGRWLMRKRKN